MSKDRAAPFSRKHRRYWIPVTGGMILICIINLAVGYCAYEAPSGPPERIELDIPQKSPSGSVGSPEDGAADRSAPGPAPGSSYGGRLAPADAGAGAGTIDAPLK